MLAAVLCSLAFAPAPVVQRTPAPRMRVADMEGGASAETGGKLWDPLDLSGMASERTLAWYRAAELKHGRVAMAAWLGFFYMTTPLPLFRGAISLDGTTFESLGRDPFAAWDAVPAMGKAQMLLVIGAFEFLSEYEKPHYMSGGTPGKITLGGYPLWDPIGFVKDLTPAQRAEKRLSELKNGRLAMIGMMSLFAAHSVPGSVPVFGGLGKASLLYESAPKAVTEAVTAVTDVAAAAADAAATAAAAS